ncbi:DAZ-associated protein 2 isoform X2 [Eurosta solidaginis]
MVNTGGPPTAPSANVDTGGSSYVHRPPPPSYEESQRMYGSTAINNRAATANHLHNSYMPTHSYSTPPQSQQMPMRNYTIPSYTPPPQYYQQHYVTATAPATFNNTRLTKETHVLSLAPGAKIRTPTGAVSIPPPPPGYAPTAAQYAAMQGQPVVLKKTKRSFF